MEQENPYLNLYLKKNITVGKDSTVKDAEQVIRELGQMYNAVGFLIKDFVKLLKPCYQSNKSAPNNNESPLQEAKGDHQQSFVKNNLMEPVLQNPKNGNETDHQRQIQNFEEEIIQVVDIDPVSSPVILRGQPFEEPEDQSSKIGQIKNSNHQNKKMSGKVEKSSKRSAQSQKKQLQIIDLEE